MPRNEAAAPSHVCPGIRVHIIDIVQPPGIGICIADMVLHQTIVTAALMAKTNAETPKKTRWEGRPETMRRDPPFHSLRHETNCAHSAEALAQLSPEKSRLLEGGE